MSNNAGYGVVYTPDSLADYVAHLLVKEYQKDFQSIKNTGKVLVLDPACGEGALLNAAEQMLKQRSIDSQYIGIDIENTVIYRNRKVFDDESYSFYAKDMLLPSEQNQTFEYWANRGLTPTLIIANPPWSAEKIYEKSKLSQAGFQFDVGQYDSYVLFMELSIKMLKPNGYAAFIIPDSIFSGENRELRKYLAENTQIKVISRLGEKLFPGINRATTVLVIRKAIPTATSLTECFRLTTDLRKAFFNGLQTLIESHNQNSHFVLQQRFKSNPGYTFDIDTRCNEESILRKMEYHSIEWRKVFHFGRGVEISKSGSIVTCPSCGVAQGYSKNQLIAGNKTCAKCGGKIQFSPTSTQKIIENHDCLGYKKIYVGENLHRYSIDGSSYIKLNVPGINYKEEKLYEPPKILIRKTGLGINACIDYESTYISQTVYSCNFIDQKHDIPLEYYLGVLNSRILYYYYLKQSGENEWKSHPYLTKDIIFSLPIPDVTPENKYLCENVAKYAKLLQFAYSREIDMKLETLVVALYGLNQDEIKMVIAEMNSLPDLGAINHMKLKEDELCLDI